MIIARIIDNIVINIEVADEEWISNNINNEDGIKFIVVTESDSPVIGLGWNESTGFENYPEDPISIPGPNEKWDFGDIPDDQSYDDLEAAFNGN